MTLIPMDGRLRLAKALPPSLRGAPGGAYPFEGQCALVSIGVDGNIRVLDSSHISELERRRSSTKLSTVTAQNITGDEVSLIPVGLVRAGATAESTASGEAILEGIPLGTHLASVASPFGDVEPLDTLLTDANELMIVGAPAAGVIVQCPLEWRKDKAGRDAWARARIELTGEYRGLPFTARDGQALQPRRCIVRPGLPLTVTCTASGHAPLMAELTGQPSRTVSTVYPVASVNSDKR